MASQVDKQFKNIGIMLIDDEASVCVAHSYTLRYQYGFNNISAYFNPIEALEELEVNSEKVDVILLDLRMPDIDGLTMLARIKEINPLIQVIILSVFSKNEDIASVLQSTELVYKQHNSNNGDKRYAILDKSNKIDQQRLAKIICEAYEYKRSLHE